MRSVIFVAVLALASAACDGGAAVTGPSSSSGRVEAVIRDSVVGTATVTGTLAGNMAASVWNGTRWIDLTSLNAITVPLQLPGSTTVHGEQSVPAGTYDRVRLIMQGVIARISRGSIVDGTPVASDTTLTLGGMDGRAELTVSVAPFTGENSTTTKRVVVFDLRSQMWLTQAALQTGRVEDAALQSAIIATTQSELR